MPHGMKQIGELVNWIDFSGKNVNRPPSCSGTRA